MRRALVLVALTTMSACARGGDPNLDLDARQALLDAFDTYRAVGGMNASQGIGQVNDFILSLIEDPRFPEKVTDIAIECGNALYQGTLDRYTSGEEVPLAEIRKVWRNTTQIECGFSPLNERLIPLVRRINSRLPPEKWLRVLACDPPIDWDKVRSMDDLAPFMDRDASISAVIEKEVFQKQGRKVLLILGINHVKHGLDTAVDRYEQHGYANATFVIAAHVGFGNHTPLAQQNDLLEAKMASWPVPSLVKLEGSWLAQLDPALFNEEAAPGQLGYPRVDAYLYVGRRDDLLTDGRSAKAVLDQDYIAELRRRADAVSAPPDAPRRPENVFRDELQSGPFHYGTQ
ncbi:MAG TPA: hypothetical protein VK550_01550 [Polyangiaceae bacterium]|nr:hypothetical protein [Polyangiaceae bacterium]